MSPHLVFIALSVASACAPSRAKTTYLEAKDIFAAGEQDYCAGESGISDPTGRYHAKRTDVWVAMVRHGKEWSLQEAVVTKSGRLIPRSGKAYFYFKRTAIPFKIGAVTSSTLRPMQSINAGNTRVSFSFSNQPWSWVEWGLGPKSFYLTDGVSKWSTMKSPGLNEIQDRQMVRMTVRAPEAYAKASTDRDYQNGRYDLEWAGDINGDGLLDVIASWAAKETWGNHLWIGETTTNGSLQFKLLLESADGCS